MRPLVSIDGVHHLNQVFLENLEVPAENLVGEAGKGWSYGKFLLENERSDSAFVYQSKRALEKARDIAGQETENGVPLIQLPEYRKKIARAATIYGGAREIQKKIVAKLAFGL